MTAERSPLVSIVLPLFNEEESIPPLIERLAKLRDSLGEASVEAIFVDDHSRDGTQALLRENCSRSSWMRYIRLAANSGSHIAILAGLEQARGECAVFMAADLQDPPELVPELLSLWREGNHVVWAVRERREGVSVAERALSGAFYWLMNRFSNVTYPPQGSDFALLDRKAVEALLVSVGSNPSIGGEIARLGFRQAQTTYVKQQRQFGRSKWNVRKKVKAFVDAMVMFSYIPMRIMTYVGMSVSAIGFLYAIIIVAIRLLSRTPTEGWASLMVVVLIVGGVQMMMLGVLGEYLWRTLEESRKRPLYFIEDQVPADDEHS